MLVRAAIDQGRSGSGGVISRQQLAGCGGEFGEQICRQPQRCQDVPHVGLAFFAVQAFPPGASGRQVTSNDADSLLVTFRCAPSHPFGAWIGGFERVRHAALDRRDVRAAGVDAAGVFKLRFEKETVQSEYLAVTFDTHGPDIHTTRMAYRLSQAPTGSARGGFTVGVVDHIPHSFNRCCLRGRSPVRFLECR